VGSNKRDVSIYKHNPSMPNLRHSNSSIRLVYTSKRLSIKNRTTV